MLLRTRCPQCKGKLEERQRIHPECVEAWAAKQEAKAQKARAAKLKKAKALAKKVLRARKAALKTIPDLIKEAQREFNSFIRARDAGEPCISCGTSLVAEAVGGGYDCGHFRSTGSAPHLRFDERNAAGQCKRCNRYLAGNVAAYRVGLESRIGADRLAALEADHRVHKWQRDELIAIRDTYRAKLKELKARSGE